MSFKIPIEVLYEDAMKRIESLAVELDIAKREVQELKKDNC